MAEFGPLGCYIDPEFTAEAEEVIARSTGHSPLFGVDPNTASMVGRWNELKSKGVTGVFLWERYEQCRPLVPHFQRAGTCVSRGHHQALQHAYYNALKTGTSLGRPAEIAYEPIYAGSRVYVGKGRIRGEGSVGAWAAQWLAGVNGVGGFCERGVYGTADLSQDNERWAVANSDAGDRIPPELLKELQQHTCLSHRLRNNGEIADCIASRIGVARCWDTLFGDRDSNGMSRAASRGAHCQAVIGVFLMRDGRTGFVELQSWGPNNPRGPRVLKYAGGEITLPAGCYGVSEDEYLRAQRGHWEAWASQVRRGEELR